MSKRKGLSVDEKRSRMLDFFYEKKDFFQLKELEKFCQKEKGITSMSVKDILTSLVDDGLVDTDKIGTSIYFWSFPSKARQKRQMLLNELTEKKSELEKKKQKLDSMIEEESKGKEVSGERQELMPKLEAVTAKKEEMLKELKAFRENDPEVLEKIKKDSQVAHDAANRWTDNIFCIGSWVKNKFGYDESTISKQFGIPENLDYLD